MQHMMSSTRRGGRLVFAGGLAAVMLYALLLALGGLAMPAAAGSTICVGSAGDYATLQAAVDAAQDGDTILAAGAIYAENIVITKSLNIEGRWLNDCSAKDTSAKGATVVHPETGRAFTIMPDQPGISITVAITDLTAVGDATGLGGAPPIEQSALVTFSAGNKRAVHHHAAYHRRCGHGGDWRAQVAQLADQGFIPGAPMADQVLARLAGPPAQPEPAVQAASAAVGCRRRQQPDPEQRAGVVDNRHAAQQLCN